MDRDPAEFAEASYESDFDFDANPIDYDHRLFPTQSLSGGGPYREASIKMMGVMNQMLTFLADHGYSRSKTLWGVAYAVGHPLTAGMSMTEAGRYLGCTKAAISKIAVDFLETTGLPPSPALKSEEAKTTYKKTNGKRTTHHP